MELSSELLACFTQLPCFKLNRIRTISRVLDEFYQMSLLFFPRLFEIVDSWEVKGHDQALGWNVFV